MKFVTIAVLALVMLDVACTMRPLKVKNNIDDCYKNFKDVENDIKSIIDKVQSKDYIGLIPVLINTLPRIQPLISREPECYQRIIGDAVGQKCVGNIVEFFNGATKFVKGPNPTNIVLLINNLAQGLANCSTKKTQVVRSTPQNFQIKFQFTSNTSKPKEKTDDLINKTMLKVDGLDCVGELEAIIAYVSRVYNHLKKKDFIAVLADFLKFKKYIDGALESCIPSSAECDIKQKKFFATSKKVIEDLSKGNLNALTQDASELTSDSLDWKKNCFNK